MTAFVPATPLFSSLLMLSTFLSLSSSHWLLLWLGLELNLLSFIPMIMFSMNLQETEGAIKYFMTQAMGSALILLGGMILLNSFIPMKLSSILIIGGTMYKLGLAPCHFWLPNTMAAISWFSCLILSTWQKIIPLMILITLHMHETTFMLIMSGALSSLIGGMGGMNQSALRPLLAYSSVGHLGWMICASTISSSSAIIYFMSYILIISPIIMLFATKNIFSSIQMFSISKSKISFQLSTAMLFMSLGGLPPLFGFFPKWIAIQSLASSNSILLPLILIIGALMNLYFYLILSFPMILNTLSFKKFHKMTKMSILSFSSIFLMICPTSLFLI
uniref:NADH-ubiquinone oxidoreductase chain 2 n=1 Tax=Sclerolinum brattstromi TaxID=167799 RepID=A0A0E3DQX3_9ANNE|nr:NADH dehydrogenase subunit 2 [Sclerolinum brattstromi]AIL54782.1 NADH dehydrogenase subunit 2 [Sclerolinum brattstromi]